MDPELEARLGAADVACTTRFLRSRPDVATDLEELAAAFRALPDEDRRWDVYAEHGPVGALERRVAEVLGKPAAAFFPSGVMAQQCALRTWADRAGTTRVALPDLSHLLVHEEDGPRLLHGLRLEHLTEGAVTPTAAHLRAIGGRLAAVLIELPLRDAGYLLPTWEELTGLVDAAHLRGIPVHLDGARLWESAPYWRRTPAEVAALGDTVYVSFYKGLAGMAGAVLAGPADVVDEARHWRRRMGGTVYSLAPLALGALRGLERNLPLMADLHERAVALAAGLVAAGFRVLPDPPQATAFRLFAPGTPDELTLRAIAAMEEAHVSLPAGWRAADVPGWAFTEITAEPVTLACGVPEEVAALARLLG